MQFNIFIVCIAILQYPHIFCIFAFLVHLFCNIQKVCAVHYSHKMVILCSATSTHLVVRTEKRLAAGIHYRGSTLEMLSCTMYSVLYSVHCTLSTMQDTLQSTVYSVQRTVYNVQCTVHSVQCTLKYSVQCTVGSGNNWMRPGACPRLMVWTEDRRSGAVINPVHCTQLHCSAVYFSVLYTAAVQCIIFQCRSAHLSIKACPNT